MIKYAANAFLATKMGFANEIANICGRVGVDFIEVLGGIGFDARIGRAFLNSRTGWGGSCFGNNVKALLHTAADYGSEAKILAAALEVNYAQRSLVIQALLDELYTLKGRTIALLGLSFKPETDDLRFAPAVKIAERLFAMGARVRAHDPVAIRACQEQHQELAIQYAQSASEAAKGADAIVIATEWQAFIDLDLTKLAASMKYSGTHRWPKHLQPRSGSCSRIQVHRCWPPAEIQKKECRSRAAEIDAQLPSPESILLARPGTYQCLTQ